MYSIDNITIKQYFELQDSSEYDIFIDTIKPKNLLSGNSCNLSSLKFDEVEVIKKTFYNSNGNDVIDILVELYCKGSFEQSKNEEFLNASVFDLFRVKAYLQNWITDVIERENKVLAGIPDDKLIMINAGERLKAVSHLLSKMRLAEQFSKDPEEIGNWKYTKVFNLMLANKRSNDVQIDYQNQK